MKSIIHAEDKQVLVSGKGKDKRAAFADALSKISKKLTADESKLIFRIEPKSFELSKLQQINKKEHFLFFFFPRIRISYKVILNVSVHIEYVPLKDLKYEEINTDDNASLHKLVKGV